MENKRFKVYKSLRQNYYPEVQDILIPQGPSDMNLLEEIRNVLSNRGLPHGISEVEAYRFILDGVHQDVIVITEDRHKPVDRKKLAEQIGFTELLPFNVHNI